MKVPAVLVFFILDLTTFQCEAEMDTWEFIKMPNALMNDQTYSHVQYILLMSTEGIRFNTTPFPKKMEHCIKCK